MIERRVDALDVRIARLQELEQRVASLEKVCGCESGDGKDVNDGVFGQNDPKCEVSRLQDGGLSYVFMEFLL